jgi:Fe-coproporphyrin III synthase
MLNSAILQVHPTRACNLECLHCYSLSGPKEHAALSIESLTDVIADARHEGYEVLSVSGGEPLVYQRLPELLQRAKALGLRTTVTTNGMLLTPQRLARLAEHLDLLAVSLDGVPATHNKMRNSARAFDAMAANLQNVRSFGVPFGFIFTLTQYNLNELSWVYGFAQENGATLLQIHPLEITGRARQTLKGHEPDSLESAYAYLEWLRLRSLAGTSRMRIQIDLASLARMDQARFVPSRVPNGLLGQFISPLVVESDGTVVPFVYGLHPSYALGSIRASRLRDFSRTWQSVGYGRLRELCEQTLAIARTRVGPPLFNWYDLLVEQSQAAAQNWSVSAMTG